MQMELIYQSPNFKNINIFTSFVLYIPSSSSNPFLGWLDYLKVKAKYNIIYHIRNLKKILFLTRGNQLMFLPHIDVSLPLFLSPILSLNKQTNK